MDYEEFKLKVIICPKCGKKMIDAGYYNLCSTFPRYHKMKLEIQLSRKNMTIRSEIKEDYSYLCINCVDKMEFKCYGCEEVRLKKDIKHKHGDPPDYLCKQCYKTKTAEEWSNLKDDIAEDHRWDYD